MTKESLNPMKPDNSFLSSQQKRKLIFREIDPARFSFRHFREMRPRIKCHTKPKKLTHSTLNSLTPEYFIPFGSRNTGGQGLIPKAVDEKILYQEVTQEKRHWNGHLDTK